MRGTSFGSYRALCARPSHQGPELGSGYRAKDGVSCVERAYAQKRENIMSDAKQRVNLVNSINGRLFDVEQAKKRVEAAEEFFTSSQSSVLELRLHYMALRDVAKDLEATPQTRAAAVNEINAALVALEEADLVHHRASSERGTAQSEHARLTQELADLCGSFDKVLPVFDVATEQLFRQFGVDEPDEDDRRVEAALAGAP